MTYPDQSNFQSADTGSAWWTVTSHAPDGDVTIVCSTTGYTFVGVLQKLLGVPVDWKWGPATSTALAAAVQAASGPAVLVTAVNADKATRTLRVGSLAAGIWLLHRAAIGAAQTSVDVHDISVATDAVPPAWVTVPPIPDATDPGIIQCLPIGQSAPAPSPKTDTSGSQDSSGSQDNSGATPSTPALPPAPPAPSTLTPVLNLPTGLAPPATPHGSSITWIALGVVGVLAVVGVVVAMNMTPKPALRTPGTRTAIAPRAPSPRSSSSSRRSSARRR